MSLTNMNQLDSVNGLTENNPPATLTKAEISDRLNQALGYNRNLCEGIVEAFFENISQTLERGEQVSSLDLVILISLIKIQGQVVTLKLAKKKSSQPDVS